MNKILEIKNLTNSFLFQNISLTLYQGDFVAISGSSNCGKTTLLRMILGYLPYEGKIKCDGAIENFIYFVTPRFSLDTDCTVKAEFLRYTDKTNLVQNIAKEYHIDSILTHNFSLLSKNELIKFQLALAEIKEMKLLLLDNIFLTFAEEEKQYFLQLLKEKCHTGSLTVLMATSSLEETVFTDYLYIFQGGKIVLQGKPELVYQEDHALVKLGVSNPFYVDLSLKLKFYEVMDSIGYDEDMVVNALWN